MKGARRAWDAALRISPAQPVYRRRSSARLAALAYHGIDDPDRFEEHLDHLRRVARPVSLDEVIEAARGQKVLPRSAVLITFDDGDRSVLEIAMPMLRERGMPSVAFVVAGLLDTDTPLWTAEAAELVAVGVRGGRVTSAPEVVRTLKHLPDAERLARIGELRRAAPNGTRPTPQLRREELRILESAGVAIGNHSLTHPCLTRCPEDKVVNEVSSAHDILTEALGREPRSFAYPDGDRDEGVRSVLASCGYEAAFLFDHRLSPVPPPDPLGISRVRVSSGASLDRLRIVLSGLHPAVHRLRGVDERR